MDVPPFRKKNVINLRQGTNKGSTGTVRQCAGGFLFVCSRNIEKRAFPDTRPSRRVSEIHVIFLLCLFCFLTVAAILGLL